MESPGLLPIVDPLIQKFHAYWLGKRNGRRFPARAALDPVEFHYVLGDTMLIEAQRPPPGGAAPWRFCYRMVGTRITARDGYGLTGRSLDEPPEPEYRDRIRATWTAVCESGRPAHHIRDMVFDNRPRRYEVIVLPLAADGEMSTCSSRSSARRRGVRCRPIPDSRSGDAGPASTAWLAGYPCGESAQEPRRAC